LTEDGLCTATALAALGEELAASVLPCYFSESLLPCFLRLCSARFLRAYPHLGRHKACPLDPKRAAQATREVAEKFETMVNDVLKRMCDDPAIDFNYSCLADVPAIYK